MRNRTTLLVAPFVMALALAACASNSSRMDGLLDSSRVGLSAPPSFRLEGKDLRLGDVRYTKLRFEEKEAVAWHFTPEGEFRRGVPRQDLEAYDSIKVKIFEVGVIEQGRFRGHAMERWDVTDEEVPAEGAPKVRQYHHYFLRQDASLVFLPAMTKGGEARPLWHGGNRGKEVQAYLQQRWSVALRSDPKFTVSELQPDKSISVPGQGTFVATATGEPVIATEGRLGALTQLASLSKGREVYRVPGDWMVCVYPDGLAVPLKKQ